MQTSLQTTLLFNKHLLHFEPSQSKLSLPKSLTSEHAHYKQFESSSINFDNFFMQYVQHGCHQQKTLISFRAILWLGAKNLLFTCVLHK